MSLVWLGPDTAVTASLDESGSPLWMFSYQGFSPGTTGFCTLAAVFRDPDIADWAASLRHPGHFTAFGREEGGVLEIERLIPSDADPGGSFSAFAVGRSPPPVLTTLEDWCPAEGLKPLASALHGFLRDVVWPDWRDRVLQEPEPPPGFPASFGMCRVSAAFSAAVFSAADPDGSWSADGGHPTLAYWDSSPNQFKAAYREMDGGLWDRNRNSWDGHYWLTGTYGGADVIVDLAASQYGWDDVVVTGGNDPRYRASYRPSVVRHDMDTRSLRRSLPGWVTRWEEWSKDNGVGFPPAGGGLRM